MDFSISEEQSMLADSVARFIDNDYDFDTRQKIAAGDEGFSRELWETYAELGWTAVPFAEEDGGLGGGAIELTLMMEQFGRGLLVEPFLANIVLAGGVLRRCANNDQKTRWLAPLIEGKLQAALGFAEPQARYAINNIATTATQDGDQWLLTGNKAMVLNGGAADLLIVPARTSGDTTDKAGVTLFAVDTSTPGVSRRNYKTVDALQAAEISLNEVKVDSGSILGEVDAGFAILQAVVDEATLAVCAEAVGIMRTMHDKTVEYSKQRVQFGRKIGSYQALKHPMVALLLEQEHSRSLLYHAATVWDHDPDATRVEVAVRSAKQRGGDTCAEATLSLPGDDWSVRGGRGGMHTEHLGHLLADLQFMQRAYPGLEW